MSVTRYISPQTFVLFKVAGVVPTVPDPATKRRYEAGFLDTDLELGEWARNIADGKLWYRGSSGIQEFSDDMFGPMTGDYHNHDTLYSGIDHNHDAIYVKIGEGGTPVDISEWFEIVNAGLETEYLRVKKPLCGDGEIQPWTDSGQLPPTIWEALPPATASSMGGFKLWETQFTIVDGVLKIKDSVITPAAHNHNDLYSVLAHLHDDRYFTEAETITAIANAIAALQGTAPVTLDTIQEIAAVFQNDPNMIATILSALASKAPLTNPEFTGNALFGNSSGTRLKLSDGGYLEIDSPSANDNLVIRPKGASGFILMNYGTGGGVKFFNSGTTEVASIDTAGAIKGTSLKTANWSTEEDANGNELHKYQGVTKWLVTPDGHIKSGNEIEPFAAMP